MLRVTPVGRETPVSHAAPESATKILPWKRFWAPRDAQLFPSAGFLVDASDPSLRTLQPDVKSLSELAELDLLVLLGEAGLGKSCAIQQEVESLREAGQIALYLHLAQTASESRLIEKIRDLITMEMEREAGRLVFLFLDSLDEAMLAVRKVVNCIVDAIQDVPKGTLRLRVGSRTGAWFDGYADQLMAALRGPRSAASKATMGHPSDQLERGEVQCVEPTTEVYELLPLRERDVEIACEAKGIDAEAFLHELSVRGLEPLAAHPVNLGHMLNLYAASRELPGSARELYDHGMLHRVRDAANRDPNVRALTPEQLLSVARRVAAALTLGGHLAVLHSGADPSTPGLPSTELVGGTEGEAHERANVTYEAIHAVLADSGLMSARGAGTYGFAHKSYAEVLTAQYIERFPFSPAQVTSLLFAPGPDGSARVAPQFAEVVAWIAAGTSQTSRAIRDRVIGSEPEYLLLSGEGSFDDRTKAKICGGMLQRFHERRIAPSIHLATRRHFPRLRTPAIVAILKRVISNGARHEDARDAAIAIAHACGLKELVPLLIKISLNPAERKRLRERAAHAVVELGSDAQRDTLRPLAFLDPANRGNRAIRAYGMKACWPRSLSTRELLPMLQSRAHNVMDAYEIFIQEVELEERVGIDELPEVLAWAGGRLDRGFEDGAGRLGSLVMHRAWRELPNKHLAKPLARAVLNRAASYSVAFRQRGDRPMSVRDVGGDVLANAMRSDLQRNRSLLLAMVDEASSDGVFLLALQQYHSFLLATEHFETWLEETMDRQGPAADRVAFIARACFNPNDPSHYAAWFEAKDKSETITRVLQIPTELAVHGEGASLARRMLERPSPAATPPRESNQVNQLLEFLRRAEESDARWWHRVVRVMEESSGRGMLLNLTECAVWQKANAIIRSRIQSAASRYLRECPIGPSPEDNDIHPFSAAQAMGLLTSTAPDLYQGIDDARLKSIAKHIVDGLNQADSDHREHVRALVGRLSRRASLQVERAICAVVQRELAHEWEPSILCALPADIAKAVAKALAKRVQAKAVRRSPGFGSLLAWLVRQGEDSVTRLCTSMVSGVTRRDAKDQTTSHAAAVALAHRGRDADWACLWKAIRSNPGWGDEFLKRVSPGMPGSDRDWSAGLGVALQGRLLVHLIRRFRPDEDPEHVGVYSPSGNDRVRDWRNQIMNRLSTSGSPEALREIVRVEQQFPAFDWLARVRYDAELALVRSRCPKTSLQQLIELRESAERRMVTSADDLCGAILESVDRLQLRLQHKKNPMRQFLWNRNATKYAPKDEESLSDFIKDHLELDLARGVVINREVQITRRDSGRGAKGKRLDLLVEAVSADGRSSPSSTVGVVIEIKGSWNKDARAGLAEQLVQRYLRASKFQAGVYLVGWYSTTSGRRRIAGPRSKWKTIELARADLADRAAAIRTQGGCGRIEARVLDCSLQ